MLHEASRTGGIGGEIAAIIAEEAFEWLDAPVLRVASIDTPVPYSPPLEDYYLPQTKDVWMRRGNLRLTEIFGFWFNLDWLMVLRNAEIAWQQLAEQPAVNLKEWKPCQSF